jgi:hypothetical protein
LNNYPDVKAPHALKIYEGEEPIVLSYDLYLPNSKKNGNKKKTFFEDIFGRYFWVQLEGPSLRTLQDEHQ